MNVRKRTSSKEKYKGLGEATLKQSTFLEQNQGRKDTNSKLPEGNEDIYEVKAYVVRSPKDKLDTPT